MSLDSFIKKYGEAYGNDFAEAVYRVLELEGGVVNDKDDKGGYTKYGISQVFIINNKEQLIKLGVIPNTEMSALNILERMSLEDILKIYYNLFWYKLKCVAIKSKFIRYYLFDSGVNMGTSTAVKLLQKAVNKASVEDSLVVDGIIGKHTLQAVDKLGDKIIPYFIENRMERYVIISAYGNNRKFLLGWTSRVFAYNDYIECSSVS